MKFYCISDNLDTKTGMRLAGIEGVVAKTKEEVETILKNLLNDSEIAIILITEKLVEICTEKVLEIKTTKKFPLLVTIPSRGGKTNISNSIKKYINESIGIKI